MASTVDQKIDFQGGCHALQGVAPTVEVLMSKNLTPEQAAEILGFGVSTLERWRRLGVGPKFIKLGGKRVAYLEEHLAEYVANRTRTPAFERQP